MKANNELKNLRMFFPDLSDEVKVKAETLVLEHGVDNNWCKTTSGELVVLNYYWGKNPGYSRLPIEAEGYLHALIEYRKATRVDYALWRYHTGDAGGPSILAYFQSKVAAKKAMREYVTDARKTYSKLIRQVKVSGDRVEFHLCSGVRFAIAFYIEKGK